MSGSTAEVRSPITSSIICRRPLMGRFTMREGEDITAPMAGDLRAEGDDHQRIGRLGRRCHAMAVPEVGNRPAGRDSERGAGWWDITRTAGDLIDGGIVGRRILRSIISMANGRSRTTASRRISEVEMDPKLGTPRARSAA